MKLTSGTNSLPADCEPLSFTIFSMQGLLLHNSFMPLEVFLFLVLDYWTIVLKFEKPK